MKRLLTVLITLSLLFGCVSVTSAAESAAHQIERKTFPFYFSVDKKRDEDFPLFFVDGADDLPYVDLNDWAKLMPELINTIFPNSGYQLTAQTLSAFLLSGMNRGLYFNGETVLLSNIKDMIDPGMQLYGMIIDAGQATPEIRQKVTAHGGTQAQKLELLFEEVSKASDIGAATLLTPMVHSMIKTERWPTICVRTPHWHSMMIWIYIS